MRWMNTPVMLITLLALVGIARVHAQDADHSDAPLTAQQVEAKAAWQAVSAAMQRGPQEIALGDQAILKLPEGYAFAPRKEAVRVMAAMGNQTDDRLIGLILPLSEANWIMTVNFNPEGYIKDDDAKDWKADELLDNLKEGTEEGNKNRAQMGIPAIQVTRWVESPKYDANVHHLVWSAEVRLKQGDDPDPSINYNTYVLGRDGYISMNLITSSSTIDTDKQAGNTLLAGVTFKDGKRYGDFNSSTDKIAAYGLAALVGGLAIKKLGLLAMLGVFLLKFKAILIGAFVFVGGWIKRFLGKKTEPTAPALAPPAPTLEKSPASDRPPSDNGNTP
jgi:uncharacterized membrane-anchored protein